MDADLDLIPKIIEFLGYTSLMVIERQLLTCGCDEKGLIKRVCPLNIQQEQNTMENQSKAKSTMEEQRK